jgi:spore coat polysaccharide biosynthesis protein SpsF
MNESEKKPNLIKGNIVAIVQARMGSSRLPGKVLKKICDRPMLDWVVQRAKKSNLVTGLMVAITMDAGDDVLEKFCRDNDIACFRGSPADVLDRYIQAARKTHADVIVRLTADCPLIDPSLIDKTITAFHNSDVDFAANRLPPPYKRTYPIGLDVEVVSMAALEKAWREATELYEREHVMPYIYQHPDLFKILTIDHPSNHGTYRWTVDTSEDLKFIQTVVKEFGCRMDFSWLEVIQLLKKHPEFMQINSQVKHKSFTEVDERVKGVKKK